ncbi:MAG TPA: erythromycin esterase family protein [Kofleriaceae bacterium]|nr:erythromycin esterase family protein [Kofleriaceae bacterium]
MSSADLGDAAAAISSIAHPLHDEEELDQLVDRVCRSRIVLLGESTHGTREFYQLRAALTRKLISRHGFSALAIDADWPDVHPVDRYLRGQGDDETADAALASFERFPAWRWRNTEVAELVEWMHGYNCHRQPAERVGCYGLDLYAVHASTRTVLSHLADIDPEAAARARARYACFDHTAAEHGGIPESFEDELVEELVEMQRRRTARSGRAPSGQAWFRAVQGPHAARRAEAYYRALVAGAASAWSLREAELADTVDLLARQLVVAGAPARIVVWAHNAHVGDAREPGRRQTLGGVLRQRYRRDVAIVGFTTYDGTVSCAHEWDGPPEQEVLRPGSAGSWEQVFHEVGMPRFMVTAAALRRAVGAGAERPHRVVGAVYRPEIERWNVETPACLAERYDVIVHVDHTSAIEPLPPPVPIERYDALTRHFPETYPTPL